MKKVNCKDVGDNDGFFELEIEKKIKPSDIVSMALEEVFENEKNHSLCMDNSDERALLKGLIYGTFSRLFIKNITKD